ncbi:MAG: DUF6242 domain-containing protein [Prevotellaceae bacterium]|nr:DUF6242 domain-containing protein [Prevotellaceae bacterium]
MNKYFSFFATLVVASTMLCSCLGGNDDDVDYGSDTAISSFTLNTIYRTMHTQASDGSDSTYTSTLSASNYKFSIDHLNGIIENLDSLPKWTNPDKVLCTVTAYNSGVIAYLKPTSGDTLFAYNSADTMDFSKPIEFRVYSPDGSNACRKYTVSINIHQEEGDSMRWEMLTSNSNIAFEKKKLYSLGSDMFLMGVKDGATTIYKTSAADGREWENITANVSLDDKAYNNTVIYNNEFYTFSSGTLYKSADAKTWATVSTPDIENLVAAGSSMLFGIGNNKIKYSIDGGATWADDTMSDEAEFLPKKDFSYAVTSVKSNAETERIIIAGNLMNESDCRNAMVWSKVIEKRADSYEYSWTRVVTRTERHGLPYTDNLSMTAYDDMLVSMNNENFLTSTDNGMVWNIDTTLYKRPEGFNASATEVTMAVDANKWLWIVDKEGEVWKARINRLAWREEQTAFKE